MEVERETTSRFAFAFLVEAVVSESVRTRESV